MWSTLNALAVYKITGCRLIEPRYAGALSVLRPAQRTLKRTPTAVSPSVNRPERECLNSGTASNSVNKAQRLASRPHTRCSIAGALSLLKSSDNFHLPVSRRILNNNLLNIHANLLKTLLTSHCKTNLDIAPFIHFI
jgi:hypothetical protein